MARKSNELSLVLIWSVEELCSAKVLSLEPTVLLQRGDVMSISGKLQVLMAVDQRNLTQVLVR